MSPLAVAVYEILRRRQMLDDPRITYAELAGQLRDQSESFDYVHHRNRALYLALDEVGTACRQAKLPLLPALVVRADSRRPGEAYFAATAESPYRGEQIAAWKEEVERIKAARYPASTRLTAKNRRNPEETE